MFWMALLIQGSFAQTADLIVFNGKILTVDPRFRVADSLAVRGARILAVGTQAEVARLVGF